VHEAFLVDNEARPRPRRSELETETRPRRTNSKARPSRGTTAPRDGLETETEATSHIHIISRTDVVLKRSGGSLELRLNRSGIFKHNFIYVSAFSPTRPRRLLPRPRPRPSVSRPRPRPRRSVSRPRRDQGV